MPDQKRLENLLGAYVLAVADRLRIETEEVVGHSGAAAAALLTIAHFPGRTVEFLRQAIGLSHPAAVRVVDRLVAQKLVQRRAAGGGPAVALTTTAAGQRRAHELLDRRERVLADAMPELSDAESASLSAILEKALARLSDAPGTTICRLCDQCACRQAACPVVQRQIKLGAAPPEPVGLDG